MYPFKMVAFVEKPIKKADALAAHGDDRMLPSELQIHGLLLL